MSSLAYHLELESIKELLKEIEKPIPNAVWLGKVKVATR